jgi:hypothetical protein
MASVNPNPPCEAILIYPDGTLEFSFHNHELKSGEIADILASATPRKGKFVMYEWHNAHLEEGVRWNGKRARAWALTPGHYEDSPDLPYNSIASDMRAVSLGKEAAPVFGPAVLMVVP